MTPCQLFFAHMDLKGVRLSSGPSTSGADVITHPLRMHFAGRTTMP